AHHNRHKHPKELERGAGDVEGWAHLNSGAVAGERVPTSFDESKRRERFFRGVENRGRASDVWAGLDLGGSVDLARGGFNQADAGRARGPQHRLVASLEVDPR